MQGSPPPHDRPPPPPPPPYAQQQQYAPPPYYTQPYPNATYAPATTDAKATVSMVLGIVSIVLSFCYGFGFLFGIAAFVLGLMARKAIERSEGALGGGGMALAGIITGGIGGAISIIYIALFAGLIAITTMASHPTHAPPPTYVPPGATTASPVPPIAAISGVNVIDLHPSGGPLRAQLGAEYARAMTTHRKLMVMTTATWSKEAIEIYATFSDDDMEDALDDVTVVRIDVDEFKPELAPSKLAKTEVPWFFLIGPTIDPTDAISADEWGANTATVIAPVMRSFVMGTLKKRKIAPPKGTAL